MATAHRQLRPARGEPAFFDSFTRGIPLSQPHTVHHWPSSQPPIESLLALSFADLEMLATVVRLGSFTLAAEHLFVTQSAISQRIKTIEGQLGCALFIRSRGHPISLSGDGERLLKFAEDSRHRLQELHAELVKGHQSQEPLTIAAISSVHRTILPEIAFEFSKSFPETSLELIDATQSQITSMLRSGRIDIAIQNMTMPTEGIILRYLTREDIIIVASRAHPILDQPIRALADLDQYLFVTSDISTNFGRIVHEWIMAHQLQLKSLVSANRIDAVIGTVSLGRALGFMPEYGIREQLRQGSLVAVPLPVRPPSRQLAVAYRSEPRHRQLVKAFEAQSFQWLQSNPHL